MSIACMSMHTYMHARIYARTHTCTCTGIHTHTCIHTHSYSLSHLLTPVYMFIHKHSHGKYIEKNIFSSGFQFQLIYFIKISSPLSLIYKYKDIMIIIQISVHFHCAWELYLFCYHLSNRFYKNSLVCFILPNMIFKNHYLTIITIIEYVNVS